MIFLYILAIPVAYIIITLTVSAIAMRGNPYRTF